MKIEVLKKFYGKMLTNIIAYGKDEYDFSRNILGSDFSVGQYGYVIFEFENERIYISIDGLSETVSINYNVKELNIDKIVVDTFVGSVLSYIKFDGEEYEIKFEGLDCLVGSYYPNEGLSDRSYFDIDFLCF